MRVYSLTHLRPRGDHADWPLVDVKRIGFFASQGAAQDAIRQLRFDPGFRRFLDGFRIECIEVDTDLLPGGFAVADDARLIPEE